MTSFTTTLIAALWFLSAQIGAVPTSAASHFEAANYVHFEITVFPQLGKEFSIRLPPGVPSTANLVGFASSGRSAYLQEPSAAILHHSDELIEVGVRRLELFIGTNLPEDLRQKLPEVLKVDQVPTTPPFLDIAVGRVAVALGKSKIVKVWATAAGSQSNKARVTVDIFISVPFQSLLRKTE